jgi:hypothetical protein
VSDFPVPQNKLKEDGLGMRLYGMGKFPFGPSRKRAERKCARAKNKRPHELEPHILLPQPGCIDRLDTPPFWSDFLRNSEPGFSAADDPPSALSIALAFPPIQKPSIPCSP